MEEKHTNASIQVLWKEFFRISKDTFTPLCYLLRLRLEKQLTQFQSPVPNEKRVAIGIRRLAKGDSFSSLSLQFGVGTSTCHSICTGFEYALCTLCNEYIKFPKNQDQIQRHITNFEETSQLPQIVCIADGSHIPILAPGENKEDYFNRKHGYSVNLLGVVDINMLFLYASVGYLGSIHDSRILQLSDIYQKIEHKNLLSVPLREITGFLIKPQMIGDSALTNRSWIIKPYPNHAVLTPTERCFHAKLCGVICVVEQAFDLLKSR